MVKPKLKHIVKLKLIIVCFELATFYTFYLQTKCLLLS